MVSNQSLQRKEKIKTLILHGELLKAKNIASLISFETLRSIIFNIAYDEKNISAYTFIFMLLCEKESVKHHCLASEILNIAFFSLEGAYEASMFHIKRSIELDPSNIELKESLLFFNVIPCKLLSDAEAEQIALEIIKKKKDSKVAYRFIKNKS